MSTPLPPPDPRDLIAQALMAQTPPPGSGGGSIFGAGGLSGFLGGVDTSAAPTPPQIIPPDDSFLGQPPQPEIIPPDDSFLGRYSQNQGDSIIPKDFLGG